MKVYMASVFADKDRVAVRSAELRELGITPTNRWQDESAPHNCTINDKPDEYFRETAVIDIDDIIAADVLVLTRVDLVGPAYRPRLTAEFQEYVGDKPVVLAALAADAQVAGGNILQPRDQAQQG